MQCSGITRFFFSVFLLASCTVPGGRDRPLAGKVICLDPGHGGTASADTYRVGPGGEREEWINLRVALWLRKMLRERGARVVMTRSKDVPVGLKERAIVARENHADVFLSVHHNATADSSVNFPIIYFHGNASENPAGVALGRAVARRLVQKLFSAHGPVSLVSDHTIFPGSGTAVLRHSYGIPGVIAEASFFTNPTEEARLKNPEYNKKEALAYLLALEDFFQMKNRPILAKNSLVRIEPFPVFQEAERMNEIARKWREDFNHALRLFLTGKQDSLTKAFQLFTRSARSFPDSYLAGRCHYYRAQILQKWGKTDRARMEQLRVREYYPDSTASSQLLKSKTSDRQENQ